MKHNQKLLGLAGIILTCNFCLAEDQARGEEEK